MLLLSGSVLAQQADNNPNPDEQKEEQDLPRDVFVLKRGVNEWGVWGAISIKSRTPIGRTIYRTTWLAGIRYGRVVGVKLRTAFEYTLDFVPMELVLNDEGGAPSESGVIPTQDVYGFGFWPAGIKFSWWRKNRIKPFLGINGGMVFFTQPVPFEGRRLNIAGNLDAGIQFQVGERGAITLAYKYHHVSNAYTAERNVGTNVNMLMVGYSIFK